MSLKDEWKETGKGLGKSFAKFGKSVIKSARTVVDKVDDKVNDEESVAETENESNVFNDGTWRDTGKGLGSAFKNLGVTLGHTAKQVFIAEPVQDEKGDDNDDK